MLMATCPICHDPYNDQTVGEHNKDRGHFTCKICQGKFKDENGLTQHLKKIHGEAICPICHDQYNGKTVGEHNKDKGHFTCKLCQKKFKDNNGLVQHLAKSHGEVWKPGPDDPSPSSEGVY